MTYLSADKALAKAKFYAKNGNMQEARKFCETFLQSYPKNLRVRQFLTKLDNPDLLNDIRKKLTDLYNQAEYKMVVNESKRYLAIYPDNIFLWNFLGVGNLALGEDLIALEAFIKTTIINPKFVDGFNNWGVTLDKIGEFDQAIKIYSHAISINPNFSQSYNNLGNVLRKKGENTKAIEMFNKAISIQPFYSS